MPANYTVVSYGSLQTGDGEGVREHGTFDDSAEALRMAQVVVETSLRQDAATARSAEELGTLYFDFGIVPVIWGEPKIEFDAHGYAVQVAPSIWSEYLGWRRDTLSKEVQWEQAKARRDKLALMRALALASRKHRDQRGKYSSTVPYINHPVELARVLAEEGGVTDTAVLCAALLHDTLEKTETSAAELANEFGPVIAGVVAEVSDDMTLSTAERKRRQVERAGHVSRRAKLVTLADKITNLREVAHADPDEWPVQRKQQYFDWAKDVIDGLRGVHPRLEAVFDDAYRQRPA